MKQLSSVLNIILLVAVGVLFYLHFAASPKKETVVEKNAARHVDSCLGAPVIAFVDLDSLNANVDYIKNKKKEIESEQNGISSEYNSSYKQMENDKNDFIKKKGNTMTQNEAEEFQAKLMQRQQQVENTRQIKTQNLAQKSAETMERMQRDLKSFLNEYNKDHKYTYILATGTGLDYMLYRDSSQNITADVVKGLNEIMNKKGKQ